MRQIQKHPEPKSLTEWRARFQNDVNFGYGLLPPAMRAPVIESLLSEQGGLCAYTGRRIERDSCHIEHIKPQCHCARGEDVDYHNLVACHPAPNTGQAPYGAHPKQDWPSPADRSQFISPLDDHCEKRFRFSLRGEIESAQTNDLAAKTTIGKLRLDHPELVRLRKEAIDATLQMFGRGPASLSLKDARRRLTQFEQMESSTLPLEPFCFALKQALRKHIIRVEAIRESKRRGGVRQ